MRARVISSTLVGNKVVLKNGYAVVVEDEDREWFIVHTNSLNLAFKIKEHADAYIRNGAELDEVISAMRSKAIVEGTDGGLTELPAGVWYSMESDNVNVDIAKFYAAKQEQRLLERLADLAHQIWCGWSKAVKEEVSEERRNRWENLWVPYSRLPEEEKENDRDIARKILALLKREGIL